MLDLYDWLKKKLFRPLRCLEIICVCPLRADCKTKIAIRIITGHSYYTPEQIFDFITKAIGKHLTEAHNVKFFQGIEYRTENAKYTLMGNYIHKEKNEGKIL